MWSVGTILNGLLSFMYENNITTGSISSSKADKKRLAAKSLEQNLKSPLFRKLFPEWVEEHRTRQQEYQVQLLSCCLSCFCSKATEINLPVRCAHQSDTCTAGAGSLAAITARTISITS